MANSNSLWDTLKETWDKGEEIFDEVIDDIQDLSLKYNCLTEFTGMGTNAFLEDTSSNGIRGILTGDYDVKKQEKGVPTVRDSVMKTPKVSTEDDGAI